METAFTFADRVEAETVIISHPSRLGGVAMVAFLLAFCLGVAKPVAAQTVSVGIGAGFPGDVVATPITLHAAGKGIVAIDGEIQFDPNAFSVNRCSINPAIGSGTATDKGLGTNLFQPGLERFIVHGQNDSVIPNGLVLTCELSILAGASTSGLTLQFADAADAQASAVPLALGAGRVIVLDATAKSHASRQCNPHTCAGGIDSCLATHGCDTLRGHAAASCKDDCREAVVAACQEDSSLCVIHATRQCTPRTCRSEIDNCVATDGCDNLRGRPAALCKDDCRQAVVAACQEDSMLCVPGADMTEREGQTVRTVPGLAGGRDQASSMIDPVDDPQVNARSVPAATDDVATIPGDVNGDDRVNSSDATKVVNVFLGTETDPTIVSRADVNGDGKVNVFDVQRIVDIFLGD